MDGLTVGPSEATNAYANRPAPISGPEPASASPAGNPAGFAAATLAAALTAAQPANAAPPPSGPSAAASVAPSPTPQAERAGMASLPIAVKFAPSDVPPDALRATGFDSLA